MKVGSEGGQLRAVPSRFDKGGRLGSRTGRVLKKMPMESTKKGGLSLVIFSVFVVIAGVASGWVLSGRDLSTLPASSKEEGLVSERVEVDESIFSDSAEGTLVEGGIENEGTHHLEREGGPSKNVYLTSTMIDLQSFVGKNVKVWGETISGQSAGWLMDVGKVKVLD